MSNKKQVVIFGEVLFDCFSSNEEVIGGAPFNVAWHLQAFGDKPTLISRVGQDDRGEAVRVAMAQWGMDSRLIQSDSQYPTGRVDITVVDNEPHYEIVPDMAYDFIAPLANGELASDGILYHGSLALRQAQSKHTFTQLCQQTGLPTFVDVNLRSPWWNRSEIEAYLHRATWAKLNHDELSVLGFDNTNIEQAAKQVQRHYDLEQVIVTRGEQGALVCTKAHEIIVVKPPQVSQFVDTVGAGDAFTARYIHGLLSGEALDEMIDAAQRFAIKIIGNRGAISTDKAFYR